MVRSFHKESTRIRLLGALWLGSAFSLALVPAALGQAGDAGAIRVQSNDVIVPVVVLDKKRVAEFQHIDPSVYWTAPVADGFRALESVPVRDLAPGDFAVFEDGQQRSIESVRPELQKDSPVISDNLGQYREITGIGGGTWAIPLWENDFPGWKQIPLPPLPGYLLGYTPPSSLDGTCHQIRVMVDRPDSMVFARSEYCSSQHSAADPLRGTKLGHQIESDLQARRGGKIALALAAIPLLTAEGKTGVRIVVDYSSKFVIADCAGALKTVGIRGVMYGANGIPVVTFSDLAWRSGNYAFATASALNVLVGRISGPCRLFAPFRYETQFEVPPGKYDLRVGLMDGKKFGFEEVPVTVDAYGSRQLEVSGLVLARRFREVPIGLPEIQTELPGGDTPLIAGGIQVTPSAETHFQRGDPFHFYFQVYEPPSSAAVQPTVQAHLRVVDAKTRKVMAQLDPVDAASYRTPGSSLIPFTGAVDVSALPSGSYRLEAQATSSAGNTTPWHGADFTIQ